MNPIKIKWDLFIIILAVYNCISLPIELSMMPLFLQNNPTFELCNTLIDLAFFFDIIISFRTIYINLMTGDENNNPKDIAINYLAGKFTIDLLSTIPFDTLSSFIFKEMHSDKSKKLVLFSCLKLVRILRLSRIIDYMKSSDEFKL